MKKIFIILISILLVTGCSSNKIDLEAVMKENNYVIVDVRTKEEYEEAHIIEAINIPYDQIDENTDLDKTKTILVYCRSGNRSNIAYNTLKKMGYTVYDLGAFSDINLSKE